MVSLPYLSNVPQLRLHLGQLRLDHRRVFLCLHAPGSKLRTVNHESRTRDKLTNEETNACAMANRAIEHHTGRDSLTMKRKRNEIGSEPNDFLTPSAEQLHRIRSCNKYAVYVYILIYVSQKHEYTKKVKNCKKSNYAD